jgi:CRP-like cAMP-binding protein
MLDQDYFGFCTTLKPLELKALGELSRVRHLAEGETVYSTGDPGDAIYIISRGVVEVIQPSAQKSAPAAYLSRGDILGDVEALSGVPRKYVVRTCEPVSLQCFQQKDFPELIRRIPSFFHYLSAQLAFRLSQASDLAVAQSHCLELSGNLANFDLITIYQTIANSSQTGELRISNPNGELVSAFFFENGQPRCGQFEHLTGEEAFWQLFVSEELAGTFAFSTKELPVKDWIQSERITKNASEMLINALQGRDEFAELKQRFGVNGATLQRHKANLSWPAEAPRESKAVAEQIWELAAKGPVTVLDLFHHCALCELKVYQVVEELVQSHHFVWSELAAESKVA